VCLFVCLSVCPLINRERIERLPPIFQGSSMAPRGRFLAQKWGSWIGATKFTLFRGGES